MTTYEERVLKEAIRWEKKLHKRSSVLNRSSKKVQIKINQKIPEKVHNVVTESIKKMIEAALFGSDYIYKIEVNDNWSLEEREDKINQRLRYYRRTAAIEGAGTGAGGILLGLADFPLLLSIKMKFLFDVGQIYGFDVKTYEERMYLLHVFLLAFSSDNKRKEVAERIRSWETSSDNYQDIEWKTLQLEYRDTIDFVKMLQLIPGFGALIGAYANTKLLNQLGETAMNAYRLRIYD